MFCPKCDSSISDAGAFCEYCELPMQRSAVALPQFVSLSANVSSGGVEAMATKPISDRIVAIVTVVAALLVGFVMLFSLGGCGGSGVAPKASVNDYTWDELSKISNEIGMKDNESDAVNIAKKYNLVNSDGKLDGTQIKGVQLTNGTTAMVQIAGFSHDDKSGGGKAGITFIFKDAIASREMSSIESNSGGWEGSGMRSWISTDGLAMLPQDLSSKIVAVDKRTNNVGETGSSSSVTTTSDKLWLFAYVELSGSTDNNSVLAAEGSEYKLFRDCNVKSSWPNNILTKSYNGSSFNWWERSPVPYSPSLYNCVGSDGYPSAGYDTNSSRGVVCGFCI